MVARIAVLVSGEHKSYGSSLSQGISRDYDLNENNRDGYLEECILEAARMNPDHGNLRVISVTEYYFDEESEETRTRVIYSAGSWKE